MEFLIPEKYQKRYLKDAVKKATKNNRIDEKVLFNHLSSNKFAIDFKETNWFKEHGVLLDVETGDYNCFCYAFNKLNIRSFGTENYSEFIAKPEYFTEIDSVDDFAVDQLVAYYSSFNNILHVGLILETSDNPTMVRSKWGLNAVLVHPIFKVDPIYGDKYKVFSVDIEKCRQDRKKYWNDQKKEIENKCGINFSRFEELYGIMPYSG